MRSIFKIPKKNTKRMNGRAKALALSISRGYAYINTLFRESVVESVLITSVCLIITVQIQYALRCYQTALSISKSPYIRTLTRKFPKKTDDPFLLGFSHKLKDSRVIHKIRLPVEVLESVIKMKALGFDEEDFNVQLRGLFTSLQPVTDHKLLSWNCRISRNYDIPRMIETVRQLSDQWGFDPRNLEHSYLLLGAPSEKPVEHRTKLPTTFLRDPMLCEVPCPLEAGVFEHPAPDPAPRQAFDDTETELIASDLLGSDELESLFFTGPDDPPDFHEGFFMQNDT